MAKSVHFREGEDMNKFEVLKSDSREKAEADMADLVKRCRIDLSEKLEPPPVAMKIRINNDLVTLFTKGNFSIVTGPAKSKKTFLISMFMAAAITGNFQDVFICPTSGINLIFDTEQSRYKVQQIAKRICELCECINPENLQVYTLRTLDPWQRIELIENIIINTPNINFVAIDGIIDLDVDPILQSDQAQRIISKLMKWTENYNIHIVCVLHYNKNVATLLGHLGSFSHRKADAIISVIKDKNDGNISLVEPIDCREKEFTPFAFSIDSRGMPYILHDYCFEKKNQGKKTRAPTKEKAISPNHLEQSVHSAILDYVFKIQDEQGYAELWRNIKNAYDSLKGGSFGDNKAKEFLTYYVREGRIIKVDIPKKKSVYTMAGQKDLGFK